MKAKKLPSGNWNVQVYLGKVNGKTKFKSITAPTKKEAEYLAHRYLMERTDEKDSTIKDAVESYIDNRREVFSPSTIRGYVSLKRSAYNDIGDMKISKTTSEDIQKYVNDYARTHSPKTTRNAYGLLIAAIHAIQPDKAINVRLPQKEVLERNIPGDNEVKALLDACDGYVRRAILLASVGTLRRGEVCAVMYEDVDGTIIHVHADMVEDENGKAIYKEIPKTNSSDRFIPFPENVIAELGEGEGFIVPLTPTQLSHRYNTARKRAGLNIKFHDLRHYAASIMHAIGIPDQYIMERGGWSSDATLKSVYRNVLSEKRKEFADAANNYFGGLI